MSESVRAWLIIMCLSAMTLALARKPLTAIAMKGPDFKRRSLLWLALVTLAFFSHSYWVYAAVAAALLMKASKHEPRPMAAYAFLLLAVPSFPARIDGIGGLNQLFELTHPRLLSMALLLPAWWAIRRQPGTARFGSNLADLCLLGLLSLQLALQLQLDTATNTMRHGFYAFMDVFLPYYVASRSLRSLDDTRDVISAFLMGVVLLVPLAMFEAIKHWLLFNSLPGAMGVETWAMGGYLLRDGLLRAVASTGHSLVLGYLMVIALALSAYVGGCLTPPWRRLLLLGVGLGLIAPVSRGPWIGAASAVAVLWFTSPQRWSRLGRAVAVVLPLAVVLALSPIGDRVFNLLPFVGTVDDFNVTYRQRLFSASLAVIEHNPWFGTSDFLLAPEMQEMVQGEGIIDVVNSYLGVALASGLVGLALFVGVFASAAWYAWQIVQRSAPGSEGRLLGRALMAALAGVLVTISTVSSINQIPTVYWWLAGVMVGLRQLKLHAARQRAQPLSTPARRVLWVTL